MRVYAGGTHEAPFLEDVFCICGEGDAPATSLSTTLGTGAPTPHRRAGADPRRLHPGALPSSRAVVMPSGTYPLVVRKVAWHHTKAHRGAAA